MNPQIKNFILFLVALLTGVILGLVVINLVKSNRNYYAVFLNNGAVYFGKLSTFPRLKLDNAIFIQIDQNGQLSLQRFQDAAWMPKGPIYLNRNSIVFIAPISENSPLINLIEGKQVTTQPPRAQPQPQSQSQPSQVSPTTTPQR